MKMFNDIKKCTTGSAELRAYNYNSPIPEHRLLTAMLLRCLKDLAEPSHIESSNAFRFIRSESNEVWSFNWLCIMLDLDSHYIQNMSDKELIIIGKSLYNR